MKLKLFLCSLTALLFTSNVISQNNVIKEGTVSYISAQMVYVKFENTEGIEIGDSLFINKNKSYSPKLIVKFLSSISASCEKIDDSDFKRGDKLYAFIKKNDESTVLQDSTTIESKLNQQVVIQDQNLESSPTNTSDIFLSGNYFNGRYSIQSYSNISNYKGENDYQSWRHSLRIDYENIGYTNLSFYAYSIFNYRTTEWSSVTKNYFNALRIYDLHLKYEFNSDHQIWIGRFLNPRISNLSTVDGLLLESNFNIFSVGVVAGTRPDWGDFTFNSKLIECGVYLFRSDSLANGFIENTISLFQQTNNSRTDRRFIYFQHSNNAIRNFNLFASSEVDLYKRESGVEKNQFNLTSAFLSATYYPAREFSLNVSYDARKNVIYYETLKSLTDSVLENETRQGFRVRTTFKPFKYFGASLFAGYRFRKSDVKPSRNFGASIYYSFIPLIESGINISYNKLISNYVDGDVYSVYMSKSLTQFNSDISIGYRKTAYKFPLSQNSFDENALLIDYNLMLFKQLNFSVSYEGAFENRRTTSRFLVGITTRF
ncbi:hypothetical protein [Ignavibacterium sp.]|uniref:hypothetical protein n=1 Tax=Ignavibacterium sp. TaxID=2651167 RepID=UPI00307CF8F2